MKRIYHIALALALTFACISCDKQEADSLSQDEIVQPEGLEVVDGKVTFNICLPENSPFTAAGLTCSAGRVRVNNKEYSAKMENGKPASVTVNASANGKYEAILYSKNYSVGQLPLGQIYSSAANLMKGYPLFATFNKENGNNLLFEFPYSLLDLNLKGGDSILSIKVESQVGKLCGDGFWSFPAGGFNLSEGGYVTVLNCTEGGNGVKLSSSGTHFYVVLAPGDFQDGLKLTICDAGHGMMTFKVPATKLAPGKVLSVEKVYSADESVVFYEGFDNCVWGGNYLGGSTAFARSALGTAPGIDGGETLKGDEDASYPVDCGTPGTGYIQSNTWNEVKGYSLATSHRMTDSYVKSRGFKDYIYLFRCQEYQGCIAVGAGASTRGILRTAAFTKVQGIISAQVSIDFCLKEDFNDNMQVDITHAGFVTSATIDGKNIDASKISYEQEDAIVQIPLSMISRPITAKERKSCHTLVLNVDRVTNGTSVYITSASSSSGKHGIFVDSIIARKTGEMQRGTLRVLYWNIQNGMWADEANNYDNFAAFVKRYDPDICVWCESATIYKTNTGTGLGNSGSTYKGYLPAGWTALAKRYGHSYTAIGGARDNYPQTVTSKHPITTLLKITSGESSSKPISHGAGLHRITVGGKDINIVTLHTWPQQYGYGVSSSNQSTSAAANEGDKYREYELNYIVSKTVNSATYSSQQDWLMMGDFNSRSRVDNWHYQYDENSTKFLCLDVISSKTGLKDIIAETYPNLFVSSTYGNSRIDYMYASPSMLSKVKNAMMLNDEFNIQFPDRQFGTSFYLPSDHRPILVDFNL